MTKKYSLIFIAFLCFSLFGYGQTTVTHNFSSTAGNIDTNISYTTEKNSANNAPYYGSELRLYYESSGDGCSITLHPSNGAVITEVKLIAISNSYVTTVKYNEDGGTDVTSNPSGSTYTMSSLSTETSFKIRNANTTSKQLRVSNIEVTYTTPSASPTLTATAVSDLDYEIGNGPSTSGSFEVTGANLTGSITVAAPTNFSIATTSGGTYGSSVTIPAGSANGTSMLYAILNSGLAINTYSGNATISSTGATSVTPAFSGEVTDVYVGPCGSESFESASLPSSYDDGSFTGDNGVTWTYVESRDENSDANSSGISGNALMLRQFSDGSKVTSSIVSGGIGDFSVKLYKGFTGGGDRQVELYVNGILKGTSTTFDDYNEHIFTVSGINIAGNVSVEIRNIKSKQIIVDDIEWTCYSAIPEPEIEIQGNSTEITDGDATPDPTDDTDFGNVAVAGGTNAHTFTINNIGTDDLNITSITSSNNTEFAISGATLGLINPSNSVTFVVTFDPSAVGTRTATITVNNDDADEATYNFNVAGNGTNSNLSAIVDNTNYSTTTPEFNSNTEYIDFINGTAMATGKFIPMKLKLIDGPDADGFTTKLTDITFTVEDLSNVSQLAMIKTAILTTTGGTPLATATKIGNELAFSGMNSASLTATDDDIDGKIFHLRVSIDETQVIDQIKLVFKVTSATADPSGSSFAAADAGGAETDTGNNNRNKLNVTADRLMFTTQPTSTSVNTNLNTFNLSAVDQFGNIDLDQSSSINLTTSGSGLIASSPYNLVNGNLAISNVQFNVSQTSIYLTATTTGLAFSNTINSNDFDILDLPSGTYRTTSNGTWPSGTATWERLTTGWNPATPAANTTELLIIRHTITSRASFAAPAPLRTSMIVESGGSFDDGHNSTFRSLLIQSGGEFIASDSAVDIDPTGTITVENGGLLVINSSTLNHGDGLFDGTEHFEPNSTVEVRQYDNDTSPGEDDLIDSDSAISLNSEGYYFGNLFINFTFNLPSNDKAFTLVGLPGTQKLCSGDLTINNNTTTEQVQLINRNTNVEIGGNVIVTKNKFSFGTIGSSNVTHTVKGNVIVNGTGAIIDLNTTSSGSGSVLVNIEGDLIGIEGTLTSTDGDCGIAFTGSTLQNINVDDSVPYKNINTYVKNNAEVQLLNKNLKLNNSSTFTVENGGSFNFNWAVDNTTPLLITNGGSGSNTFDSEQGSILKITHLSGLIKTTANAGNVQLSTSNKTFNQAATFHYRGKADQGTGDALSGGSSAKLIICELENATDELTVTSRTGTSNLLDIKQGIVVTTDTNHIYGSGNLNITADAGLRSSILTATSVVPALTGSYNLTGGFIKLDSNTDQVLRGARAYRDLIFSNSGTKTVSSAPSSITGTILVQDAAILNVEENTMGGANTYLTMTGTSEYITDGVGVKPDALETYNLGVGTKITFVSSNATLQGIRLFRDYYNIDVVGSNVGTTSLTLPIRLQSGGTFTVKPTGTFKFINTAGFNSNNITAIDNTNSPTITLEPGSTVEYAGDNQTLTEFLPNYSNLNISGTGIKQMGTNTGIAIGENLNVIASELYINNEKFVQVEDNAVISGELMVETKGAFVQVNDSGTFSLSGSGTATANKVSASKTTPMDYTYWSSPITSITTESVLTGTPAHRKYEYVAANYKDEFKETGNNNDETTLGQDDIDDNGDDWTIATGVMTPGSGYAMTGPSILPPGPPTYTDEINFIGTFNTADIPTTIYENGFAADNDWNLVGNPYPSAIDFSLFHAENSTIIDGCAFIWSHTRTPDSGNNGNEVYNFSQDDYSIITVGSGCIVAGPTLPILTDTSIPSGQGFFVIGKHKAGSGSSANAVFKNAMRIADGTSNNQFYRNAEPMIEANKIWVNLTSDNGIFNQALIAYVDGATDNFDSYSYDAPRNLSSGTAAIIYTKIEDNPNKNFAIQGKHPNSLTLDEVIPLGFYTSIDVATLYTFSIAQLEGEFMNSNAIYILDKLNNTTHNLKDSDYTFTSETGEFNERFEIVFTPATLSIDDTLMDANEVTITELQNGDVQIKVGNTHTIKHVAIIDVTGRIIYNLQGNDSIEVYDLSKLSQAAYIAKITLSNGQVISKKAIKQR